jgi:hypothetical protein
VNTLEFEVTMTSGEVIHYPLRDVPPLKVNITPGGHDVLILSAMWTRSAWMSVPLSARDEIASVRVVARLASDSVSPEEARARRLTKEADRG